jgi:transposase
MNIFGGMRNYKAYEPAQAFLLPPNPRDWLQEGHLAWFVMDVVATLDLSAIYTVYESGDGRGQPPYHPLMMTSLLIYGYCTGKVSSRRLEDATYEEVPYRVIAGGQHPDHDSIADFRQRHLENLSNLFVQVLELCRKAGLVKLGHVALDGSKVKANASKHKAMSYGRMSETEKRLEEEVKKLLEEAVRVDAEEDAKYGKGKRKDELPEDLKRRESRLKKIREAKAALEAEAKVAAEAAAAEAREKIAERERKEAETGKKTPGKKPEVPDVDTAKPEPKAQKNFTDPESRIMKDGATKEFIQGYSGQAAVDSTAQVIVGCFVTQETNDKKQLIPLLEKVKENTGKLPDKVSADSGYFSEKNLTDELVKDVDLYVPPDRQKHGATDDVENDGVLDDTVKGRMKRKLKSAEGKAVYKMRKAIVEPVFGQTKEARGFRRFSFRGFVKVSAEWDVVCLTHNLLKLFRSGWRPGWPAVPVTA